MVHNFNNSWKNERNSDYYFVLLREYVNGFQLPRLKENHQWICLLVCCLYLRLGPGAVVNLPFSFRTLSIFFWTYLLVREDRIKDYQPVETRTQIMKHNEPNLRIKNLLFDPHNEKINPGFFVWCRKLSLFGSFGHMVH